MATNPYYWKNAGTRHDHALVEDNVANWDIQDTLSAPIFRLGGGIARSGATTYSDGDNAVFNFDTDGYLRCTLKSAITVSGDLAVDVWSFRTSADVDADAWVYSHDEDLSAVTEVWQGFGGYDETADRFRAFPIGTDNATAPADAQGIPILGEYNATPVTLDDGDFGIPALDVSSHLMMSGDFVYADDSAFIVATDEVVACGYLADEAATDSVDEGDIGLARMTLNRQIINTQRLTDGSELAYDAGVVGADVQRITLGSDDPAVASLAIIDDWDESDRAKVNPIVGQAGIAANAGVMDALTTRTTLATDDTHYGVVGAAADVDGVVHGQLRYIGEAALAIQTAVEILDDWDESDRSKVNLIVGQAGVSANSGVADATTQRVSVATDDHVLVGQEATTNAVGFDTLLDLDADETAQVLKAGAGNLYHLTVDNADPAAKVYVQLFDVAAGSVTVGTTVPKFVIPVCAGAMYDSQFAVPMTFSTAITYAVTAGPSNNVAPGATITLSAGYK